MVIVLAAIVLMLLVKAFVVQFYRIPSASMEDALLTGDRVLVNKLVYHVRDIPADRAGGGSLGSGFRGDRVVAQVLVDDAGTDVGHLGTFGQLVDDERVEVLVVGDRDMEQEVLAAGDDEHPHGVRQPGRPVPEGLDVAPGRRPDPDGDQRLDRPADGSEVHVEQGTADHAPLP